jgi:hypothetical protein
MKTKIKKLLNLMKDRDGRGVASFFQKEKDTEQLENVVQMNLPHDFVYSFHDSKVKKVKYKNKTFIMSGIYYENNINDGFIKIKLSFVDHSKIFDQLSKNEWIVKAVIVDNDSLGVIAVDNNGNLIPLVEKNKIKKVKVKSSKQNIDGVNGDTKKLNALILKKNKSLDKTDDIYVDINRPLLNLEKDKQLVDNENLQKKAVGVAEITQSKTAIKRPTKVKKATK